MNNGNGPHRPYIYLFCNHGFGLPFTTRILARLAGSAKITLVYSALSHGERPFPNFRSCVSSLRFVTLKICIRVYAVVKKVKIRVVPDVNADSFLKSVPDGCCGIVAGFDQIFKSHAINSFSSLVNFHPSILPFYRGPVPSFWVIKNHELRTGFTLHCISEQIDAGEILFQEVVECETAESPDHLNRKIALAAQHTFDRYLDHLLSGKPWSVVKLDASTIYRVPLSYGRRPGSSSNRILPSLRKA